MRYPDFDAKIAKRLNDAQRLVYIHVCGLLNRDHPVYTIDRKWVSLAEVKRETGYDHSHWEYNGYMFDAVSDVIHGYYFIAYMVQFDKFAGINRDLYMIYQITNKGRGLRMGLDAHFSTKDEAEHMINILHAIEVGEF